MHYLTFLKNNSVVVDYRVDLSIPPCWTLESLKDYICKDKNLNLQDIETVCLTNGPICNENNCKMPIGPASHLFNEVTTEVTDNPDYIDIPTPFYYSIALVRQNLTLSERVKWDGDKTETIKTAKIELAPGLLKPEATEVLQMLVDAGDISAASMQKILA